MISSLLYYGKEKYHPINETENQTNKKTKQKQQQQQQQQQKTGNKKKKNNSSLASSFYGRYLQAKYYSSEVHK